MVSTSVTAGRIAGKTSLTTGSDFTTVARVLGGFTLVRKFIAKNRQTDVSRAERDYHHQLAVGYGHSR